MSDKQSPQLNRRRLFAAGGTVGALAATAALVPMVRPEPAAKTQPQLAPDKGGGYQLTAHVQQYYDTTRT
jgi:hypothetical protein